MSPLAGRTILVTRARGQAGTLSEALIERGATVVEAPVIAFEEPADWGPADGAARRLDTYDFVIFTSVNAVERFTQRAAGLGHPILPSERTRLVAIGPATAQALALRGFHGSRIASVFRAEGVIDTLATEGLSGRRVLIPRAEAAREILPDQLRARGALVEVVSVYRTVAVPLTAEVLRLIESRAVDLIVFTSPSTVRNMLAAIGDPHELGGAQVAVIGPVTEIAARDAGLSPSIVSPRAGMEELARAIATHYGERR